MVGAGKCGLRNRTRLTVGQPFSRTQVCTTQPDHRAFALSGDFLLKRFQCPTARRNRARRSGHCSGKSAAIRFGSTGGLNPGLWIAVRCDRLDQTTRYFSGAHFNEGICPCASIASIISLKNRTSDLVARRDRQPVSSAGRVLQRSWQRPVSAAVEPYLLKNFPKAGRRKTLGWSGMLLPQAGVYIALPFFEKDTCGLDGIGSSGEHGLFRAFRLATTRSGQFF